LQRRGHDGQPNVAEGAPRPARPRRPGGGGTGHRLVAALAAVAVLVVLVVCDETVTGVRRFFELHAFTASIAASLLTLAVTLLVVDQVVARRNQKERAESVAVQSLILYGQAKRAHQAVLAAERSGGSPSPEVGEELRSLATMMLSASASLFDDPEARVFLEHLQRSSAAMLRVARRAGTAAAADAGRHLEHTMSQLHQALEPLVRRIPGPEREMLQGEL
jgi:hypothetical protein